MEECRTYWNRLPAFLGSDLHCPSPCAWIYLVSNASSLVVHGPLCNPTLEQQGALPISVKKKKRNSKMILCSEHRDHNTFWDYNPFLLLHPAQILELISGTTGIDFESRLEWKFQQPFSCTICPSLWRTYNEPITHVFCILAKILIIYQVVWNSTYPKCAITVELWALN